MQKDCEEAYGKVDEAESHVYDVTSTLDQDIRQEEEDTKENEKRLEEKEHLEEIKKMKQQQQQHSQRQAQQQVQRVNLISKEERPLKIEL